MTTEQPYRLTVASDGALSARVQSAENRLAHALAGLTRAEQRVAALRQDLGYLRELQDARAQRRRPL